MATDLMSSSSVALSGQCMKYPIMIYVPAAETKTWGWAGPTSLVLAASCWHCCTSGPNTMENTAVPGARGEELLQQVQREHVVYEEWSERSAV